MAITVQYRTHLPEEPDDEGQATAEVGPWQQLNSDDPLMNADIRDTIDQSAARQAQGFIYEESLDLFLPSLNPAQ